MKSSDNSSNKGATKQRPISRGINSKNAVFSFFLALSIWIQTVGIPKQQWASPPMDIGTITVSIKEKLVLGKSNGSARMVPPKETGSQTKDFQTRKKVDVTL